jgi:hypothetical protein
MHNYCSELIVFSVFIVVKLPAGAVPVFSIAGDVQFKAAVAKSRTAQDDAEQVE